MNKFLTFLSGAIALSTAANASITINLFAAQLSNPDAAHGGNGAIAVGGTLIQLINLGPDGIFNPITVDSSDPATTGMARWVSGDDTLVNFPFGQADFATAAGFDYNVGNDGAGGPGVLDRVFSFATGAIPAGTKLGVRWFPGLQAANFTAMTNSDGLAINQPYGQFSRFASPQHGGEIWVAPADGGNVSFDPLATQSFGGADPNSSGNANFAVVPEPASIALSLMGAAGLAVLRRRRRA